MREILFRGKSLKNGTFAEGHYFKNDNGTFIFTSPYHANYLDIDIMVKVNPKTVGQFTGVSDKNGAKIFEGDIVKQFFDFGFEITAESVFREGAFGLSARRGGTTEFTPFANICNCAFEVSGNIFDNPELLERVKKYE